MRIGQLLGLAVMASLCSLETQVAAQPMVWTTTPLQTNGDRFFESTNMSWSLRGPNFFASFGGPGVGAPRFGGYNPNAGLSSGWAFNSGKFSGAFRFNFSQGYERYSSTMAPSLMTMNGQPGYFFSGIRRPFVYSQVPVVAPGGAFFSVPSAAFHQQMRRAPTIAERVLNGDVILPRKSPTPQPSPLPVAHGGKGASSGGTNDAAFAWFMDSSTGVSQTSHASHQLERKPRSSPASAEFLAGSAAGPEPAPAVVAQVNEMDGTEQSVVGGPAASDRIASVYFQQGRKAEEQGKLDRARFLYGLAIDRGDEELKSQIQDRLQLLKAK